ncbi:kinesin-like protein KIF6 isoform X3 [Diorhabda sublineata]|uniref:kinesin-like protein KIF6 isoform X3 n=1 Tax=Diorhabda sublineata TaxID=1163346 RepID=UPI0024E08CA1|nr:kinesin-like protein KIF6 isoform X3 [Diorhabda sublineata]
MVHQHIKVYARIKKELKDKSSVIYEVTKTKKEYEDLMFYPGTSSFLNSCCGFRFYKVFNVDSVQAEVFDTVAIPVIRRQAVVKHTVLLVRQKIMTKEVLFQEVYSIYSNITNTRVTLFEDKKGDAHIRNLNVFPVTTEQEAMRFLFLGDTHRTIAETVSNEFSSRSHCIFTLYINLRDSNSVQLRSSKLHLVDLAGSERISKTHTKGYCLQEAKSINLSLHFLQQVILALSESNRTHIPYRNSMLTHILKDSLNGNCITSMLATLSISQSNIEESISTCRFAQKVSMISTDPIINVLDPQKEIHFLKLKIEDLEKKLSLATGFSNCKPLSKQKMEQYIIEVKSFVGSDKKLITVAPDMSEIQFCFNLLKNEVENKKRKCVQLEDSLVKKTEGISMLNDELLKKDKEILQLKNIIDRIPETPVPLSTIDGRSTISSIDSLNHKMQYLSIEDERILYEKFMSCPEISSELIFYKNALEKQFREAKLCAETIENCQKQINFIKQQLDLPLSWIERNQLIPELEKQQTIYKKTLMDIKNIQSETAHLQSGLKQAEVKSQHKFKVWIQEWSNNKNPRNDFTDRNSKEISYFSNASSDYKFLNNYLGTHEYMDKIRNMNTLNLNSFDNSNDFLNKHYCYNSDTETNDVPSLSCLKKDVYLKPNALSFISEHACCSTNCIHCCEHFNSDSTLPQSCLAPSSEDLVATKDSNGDKDISGDSVCRKESIPSIITLKSGGCTSDEDLFSIKKSLLSVKEDDEIVGDHTYRKVAPEKDVDTYNGIEKYLMETDTLEFREFMKSVALTGIDEIDNEIFCFYRSKFC